MKLCTKCMKTYLLVFLSVIPGNRERNIKLDNKLCKEQVSSLENTHTRLSLPKSIMSKSLW